VAKKRKDATRMVTDALVIVRRAQLEARRAKVRVERMKGLLPDNEYTNLLLSLETLDNILERVAIRLETILTSGIITAELLALPRALITKASEQLKDLPPELFESLAEIGDILDYVASNAPSQPEIPISINTETSEEVNNILEEAKKEAEKKLEESLI